MPTPMEPLRVGSTAVLGPGETAAVLRQTKILLNIHQSDASYFEWHRIINLGIANGCVVVTETCDEIWAFIMVITISAHSWKCLSQRSTGSSGRKKVERLGPAFRLLPKRRLGRSTAWPIPGVAYWTLLKNSRRFEMNNVTQALEYRIAGETRTLHEEASVSVVVPLYNYEQFIVETLTSISTQTVRGIELIVVDDGSTDASFDVANAWLECHKDHFTRTVLAKNLANSGLPYTRNVGFAIATTDCVFPIDADNLIYPRCLERCTARMLRSDAAVVYTIVERFGAERRLMNMMNWSWGYVSLRQSDRCHGPDPSISLEASWWV